MKRKSKAVVWWQPPRGAAAWLLSAAEQAMGQAAEYRAQRAARGYTAAENELLEDAAGGRYGLLLSVLLTVAENGAPETVSLQVQRVRLWLREGFAPPELPPFANDLER